jgi:thioredoxin reductase (NADPH)
MSKPTILAVDDDPQVSAAITRDLASQYGADYRIVRATSGAEALIVLTKLALRDEPVALIAADQRMPQMTGIEMLEQARAHAPGAKFLLLTAYADTDVAIKAINDIGLDYYLLKPWDPPEERLYPVIDDLLGDRRRRPRPGLVTVYMGVAGASQPEASLVAAAETSGGGSPRPARWSYAAAARA